MWDPRLKGPSGKKLLGTNVLKHRHTSAGFEFWAARREHYPKTIEAAI